MNLEPKIMKVNPKPHIIINDTKSTTLQSNTVQFFLSVPKFCHNVTFFLIFLLSPFLPYKDTFMDDYDGI